MKRYYVLVFLMRALTAGQAETSLFTFTGQITSVDRDSTGSIAALALGFAFLAIWPAKTSRVPRPR